MTAQDRLCFRFTSRFLRTWQDQGVLSLARGYGSACCCGFSFILGNFIKFAGVQVRNVF